MTIRDVLLRRLDRGRAVIEIWHGDVPFMMPLPCDEDIRSYAAALRTYAADGEAPEGFRFSRGTARQVAEGIDDLLDDPGATEWSLLRGLVTTRRNKRRA